MISANIVRKLSIALNVDVTEEDQVAAMIADTVKAFGGIDVLYSSAGSGSAKDGPVIKLDLDEF